MARVLVVAPSWIGDAVLAQPMLALLKARDPAGAIDVLAPPWALAVFRRMPEVAAAIALPFGHGELRFAERRRFARALAPYDRAIVLPNSLKSALVPWFAGIAVRTGYRGEMRYGLLNDLRRLDAAAMPRLVDRFAALAHEPGGTPSQPAPEPRLAVDAAARAATAAKFGLAGGGPIAAFCPGAEYGPAKRWPPRHFAALARALSERGARVVLLGSGKDVAPAAEVQRLSGGACLDLAGKTTLDEAIDLLALADEVVTNDSGLMHVAAALGRSVAAVFGSSSPAYTPPLSPRARVVTLALDCSPCFKRECPLGHTNCLERLEPARVLDALGRTGRE